VLTKDQHKLNRRNLVIVALIWLGLGVVGYRVGAQGPCSEENTPPPDSLGQSRAWAQNAVVTVNFDSNTISPSDYKYQSSRKSNLEERTRQAGGKLIVPEAAQAARSYATLKDLVNDSSSIIVATTLNNRSLLSEDGTSIVTNYRVVVRECLKGSYKPGDVVTISTPGGLRVFDKEVYAAVQVPEVRKPRNGKDYAFFIERTDGKQISYLTGSFQGVFELRDPEGVLASDRGPNSSLSGKLDGRPVKSFLQSVQAFAQK